MNDYLPFGERVAIVTGAGQGLGASVARALAAAGARVAVNDINPDRAERVAQAIRDRGGQALAVDGDVSNKFHGVKIVENTRSEWGRLDMLVNNAHVAPAATVLKMDEWDWNRALDVNLKGTFFMSQLCGRVMADRHAALQAAGTSGGGGIIVNVTGFAGVASPLAHRAAYCASQAGIVGFTRECAREYSAFGVRVHCLVTERDAQVAAETDAEPVGRPEEIASKVAEMVVFLCSDASRHLSGKILTIDGEPLLR